MAQSHFSGKINLFGCEIRAIHHSWAPCVYCKQQEMRCGNYVGLLLLKHLLDLSELQQRVQNPTHLLLFIAPCCEGGMTFTSLFIGTQLIWVCSYSIGLYAEFVSSFLLVPHGSNSTVMCLAEHLSMSKKNYFLVWKVAPLTWWKTSLLCQ